MVNSIKRFGEILYNFQTSFPHDQRITCAIKIFSDLTTGEYDTSVTTPQYALNRYSGLGRDYYHTRKYRFELEKNQWELALCAFNRVQPLTPEKEVLLQTFMVPILQAAIVGLLRVFLYEHYRTYPKEASNLSTFPDIQGHKYIYLIACKPS